MGKLNSFLAGLLLFIAIFAAAEVAIFFYEARTVISEYKEEIKLEKELTNKHIHQLEKSR
jgi:hypothetical protein